MVLTIYSLVETTKFIYKRAFVTFDFFFFKWIIFPPPKYCLHKKATIGVTLFTVTKLLYSECRGTKFVA